jgi:hypothetical protein
VASLIAIAVSLSPPNARVSRATHLIRNRSALIRAGGGAPACLAQRCRGGGAGGRGGGRRGGGTPASAASTCGNSRPSASVSGTGRSASSAPTPPRSSSCAVGSLATPQGSVATLIATDLAGEETAPVPTRQFGLIALGAVVTAGALLWLGL